MPNQLHHQSVRTIGRRIVTAIVRNSTSLQYSPHRALIFGAFFVLPSSLAPRFSFTISASTLTLKPALSRSLVPPEASRCRERISSWFPGCPFDRTGSRRQVSEQPPRCAMAKRRFGTKYSLPSGPDRVNRRTCPAYISTPRSLSVSR